MSMSSLLTHLNESHSWQVSKLAFKNTPCAKTVAQGNNYVMLVKDIPSRAQNRFWISFFCQKEKRAIGHLQILLDIGARSKQWLQKYWQNTMQVFWLADEADKNIPASRNAVNHRKSVLIKADLKFK